MSPDETAIDKDNDKTMGPRAGMRREPCAVCGMPVFLAEKLMISRTPYHRTCFRCARCDNQLTPGNYYETEDGQYCCETCPDEEKPKPLAETILHEAYNDALILGHVNPCQRENDVTSAYQRSLSDEEKTERRAQMTEEIFDKSILNPQFSIGDEKNNSNEISTTENISQTAQMRSNFMASQMLSENSHEISSKSITNDDDYFSEPEDVAKTKKIRSTIPNDVSTKRRSLEGSPNDAKDCDGRVDATNTPSKLTKPSFCQDDDFLLNDIKRRNSIVVREKTNDDEDLDVETIDLNVDDKKMSYDTATSETKQLNKRNSYLDDKNETFRQDTKDTIGSNYDREADERREIIPNTSQCLSLVQRRLRMFENPSTKHEENNKIDKKIDSSPIVDRNSFVDEDIANKINEETWNDGKLTNQRDDCRENEEIDSTSKIIDDVESNDLKNLTSENKIDKIIPPIVPKRSTLESRKGLKSRGKNGEVTVLNARGIDLSGEHIYPEDLNPFKSDEEDETEIVEGEEVENSRRTKVSTNPFGSSDEDDVEGREDEKVSSIVVAVPRPAARSSVAGKKSPEKIVEDEAPTKRRLKAPQIHLNPFWSDDEEEQDSEDENGANSLPASTPVPKPRTITQTPHRRMESDRSDIYASNSSLGSIGSASTPGGTCRKKKPAPPPPIAKELFASGGDSSLTLNRMPYTGSNNSLHTTPRGRKTKPAPPPPMPTSTPCKTNLMANLTLMESPINDTGKTMDSENYKTWDDLKIGKDEANRNKQSLTAMSCNETNIYGGYTDKSVQGKWKRKKGPAPARPMPHRRKIKIMSPKDVKLELDEIEVQQQGLEKQGVRLEQLIRDKAESGNASEETNLGMDVEELVLELFVLVNEKNELFRRQAELMLLRRQQRLEEEHADIEYQIRCLLCQPEATKTDFDKQREETLIQRLVEIVERRNEIVDCLEMDRRREVEEDRSINTRMGQYTAKNKGDCAKELADDGNHRSVKSKKTKLKEKAKEKILRKGHKKDADKDVDETEVKLKRQNKRKWF